MKLQTFSTAAAMCLFMFSGVSLASQSEYDFKLSDVRAIDGGGPVSVAACRCFLESVKGFNLDSNQGNLSTSSDYTCKLVKNTKLKETSVQHNNSHVKVYEATFLHKDANGKEESIPVAAMIMTELKEPNIIGFVISPDCTAKLSGSHHQK